MPGVRLGSVLRQLKQRVSAEHVGALSDGELLQAFVRHREEAAFSALVQRHGPLVLAVCRHVLKHEQDAEDAFQATFILLARHAGSIRTTQAVASWLYRVAFRTALKAGVNMARRRSHENEYARSSPRAQAPADGRELEGILHEELKRLPEKYQAPLVLCGLQGRSGTEAARQLGWKEGTVRGRLTQARRLLQQRLARRGVELGAVLGAAAVSGQAFAGTLLVRAVQAARLASAGKTALAGLVSARVLALVERVDRMLLLAKLQIFALLLLAASIVGGAGLLAQQGEKAATPPPKDAAPPARAVRVDRQGDPLPEGALARFGTVRLRQGWMTSHVLFSPDGTQLAVLGYGRPLGLWDVASGKQIHQFHERDSQPDGAAFSPDGTLLAEGDTAVRLWDTRTGALRRALPAAEASQRAVVFTPDGNTLISAGHDKLIHLWNPHTGESLGKLEGHDASAFRLAITKDGKTLASTGDDKVIRFWDLARRKPVLEIKGLDYVVELAFSPDGRSLASAEESHGPARVWDVRTGQERFRLGDDASRGKAVAYSPDGVLLASGHSDGAIRLWDAATGKEVRRWSSPSGVRSLAFAPDGKSLATISIWDSGPRLWDAASGKEIHPGDTHRGMVTQLALSTDGKSLLTMANDRQLLQWDLATQTPRKLLELPFSNKSWKDYHAQLSADGRILARASRLEKTVTLIEPQTQKPIKAVSLQAEPYNLCFSPDSQTLAIGGQEGGFYVWNWRGDAEPRRIETPEKDRIVFYLFLPDGKHLVTGSRNPNNLLMHLWDVTTGKRVMSFPGNQGMPACAVAPDGQWGVAAGFGDRVLHVIDVPNRKEVRSIALAEPVSALCFSPDGQVLAYGEYERAQTRVGLMDLATGEVAALFHGHHSGVGQLVFSPDGRSLYSGAGDSTIVRWDATGRAGKRSYYPDLAAAWEALAGSARQAYPARWDLLDSPHEAIALFRRHVQPAAAPDAEAFQKLVAQLNAASFAERQKAVTSIQSLGRAAEPLLRKQLTKDNPLEVQRRLAALHDEFMKSPAWRRTQAALAIAAAARSDAARTFLEELAAGHPDASLTLAARKAIEARNRSR